MYFIISLFVHVCHSCISFIRFFLALDIYFFLKICRYLMWSVFIDLYLFRVSVFLDLFTPFGLSLVRYSFRCVCISFVISFVSSSIIDFCRSLFMCLVISFVISFLRSLFIVFVRYFFIDVLISLFVSCVRYLCTYVFMYVLLYVFRYFFR